MFWGQSLKESKNSSDLLEDPSLIVTDKVPTVISYFPTLARFRGKIQLFEFSKDFMKSYLQWRKVEIYEEETDGEWVEMQINTVVSLEPITSAKDKNEIKEENNKSEQVYNVKDGKIPEVLKKYCCLNIKEAKFITQSKFFDGQWVDVEACIHHEHLYLEIKKQWYRFPIDIFEYDKSENNTDKKMGEEEKKASSAAAEDNFQCFYLNQLRENYALLGRSAKTSAATDFVTCCQNVKNSLFVDSYKQQQMLTYITAKEYHKATYDKRTNPENNEDARSCGSNTSELKNKCMIGSCRSEFGLLQKRYLCRKCGRTICKECKGADFPDSATGITETICVECHSYYDHLNLEFQKTVQDVPKAANGNANDNPTDFDRIWNSYWLQHKEENRELSNMPWHEIRDAAWLSNWIYTPQKKRDQMLHAFGFEKLVLYV
ncbi:hypothetical protein RFI_15973, partial [Reticulomyxa filosa]